jgi:glutamyl-tRNA synthetase
MHIGNAWAALLAWLDIRSKGGEMILRLEDIDPDRCRPAYAEQVVDDLRWLGLDWDEGPCWQSRRTAVYQAALERLREAGKIYPCWCSRAELRAAVSAPHAGEEETPYGGRCLELSQEQIRELQAKGRKPSFRLRVPEQDYSFTDEIFGPQQQNLRRTCGDFPVQRSDGAFAYQLAVVVDDIAMNITRIVRGADLLASTPRQLYLYELLGGKPPAYAHVPLLLGPDGARLSKRHGALPLKAMRQNGVTAPQLIGRLAAWAGQVDTPEPISAKELVKDFDLKKIPRIPVVVGEPAAFQQEEN